MRVLGLAALVFLINLGAAGLLSAYSSLNLWPDLASVPGFETAAQQHSISFAVLLAAVAPAVAGMALLWPLAGGMRQGPQHEAPVPGALAEQAANIPLKLAALSLLGWMLVTAHALARYLSEEVSLGLGMHLVARPVLAGLIAGSATFFAVDYTCRNYIWPRLLEGTRIAGNPRLWRVRVSHRLVALWLAISLIPLAAVALTTLAGVAALDLTAHSALGRIVSVVLLIAGSAAAGGALLAWLVARSVAPPLEAAMARVRDGRLDTRQPVNSTDETGALAEGFNLMTQRLAESRAALEARNRELSAALDQVQFLEQVKRGLDRFVPESVRRAIEENPQAPRLAKTAKDVTVLFLDIEGYARLSEALPRPMLNEIVERYFSLFLGPIRGEGGDINETAGDGLMIIFQAGGPAEHAASAVRAALAIRAQAQLANEQAAGSHPEILVNIGISSGECDVGATRFQGTGRDRWTFTATGPSTNLAARLGDRAAGGEILIGKETAERVRGRFLLRGLGPVQLKNFTDSVEAWEVRGAINE